MLTKLNPNLSNLSVLLCRDYMHIVLVHYLETKVTLISAPFLVVLSMALFLRSLLFHCLVYRAKCLASIFLTHVLFFSCCAAK